MLTAQTLPVQDARRGGAASFALASWRHELGVAALDTTRNVKLWRVCIETRVSCDTRKSDRLCLLRAVLVLKSPMPVAGAALWLVKTLE